MQFEYMPTKKIKPYLQLHAFNLVLHEISCNYQKLQIPKQSVVITTELWNRYQKIHGDANLDVVLFVTTLFIILFPAF